MDRTYLDQKTGRGWWKRYNAELSDHYNRPVVVNEIKIAKNWNGQVLCGGD